jgi:hypothetical protein
MILFSAAFFTKAMAQDSSIFPKVKWQEHE